MKFVIYTYVADVELITEKSCKLVRWYGLARNPVDALNKLHENIQIDGLYKDIKQPIPQNYTIKRLAHSYRKDPFDKKSKFIDSEFDLPRSCNPELKKRKPQAKEPTAVSTVLR